MLPNVTVFGVIVIVLFFVWILDVLLFKPIVRVMQQREAAIGSAQDLARRAAAQAEAVAAEYNARLGAARTDVYREMDERRRVALARRAEMLAKARREAEAALTEATERLRAEAAQASARLSQEADALGAAIAERVLGRKAS